MAGSGQCGASDTMIVRDLQVRCNEDVVKVVKGCCLDLFSGIRSGTGSSRCRHLSLGLLCRSTQTETRTTDRILHQSQTVYQSLISVLAAFGPVSAMPARNLPTCENFTQ